MVEPKIEYPGMKYTDRYLYRCTWETKAHSFSTEIEATTATEAAAWFIEHLYNLYGSEVGRLRLSDVDVRLHTEQALSEPVIGVDLAELGQDETACDYCTCDACAQAKADSKPIEDDELAAAYKRIAELWQSILNGTNSEEETEEEEEPEGCYLSISLSRPGRPLINFHSILDDGGDEDELIGLGIQHLRAVLEFDRDKTREKGRAAAIAANFYNMSIAGAFKGSP